MVRQLGEDPKYEGRDGMRAQADQLPGIPKHSRLRGRVRGMLGTGSVYPCIVIPSLEGPQPVH